MQTSLSELRAVRSVSPVTLSIAHDEQSIKGCRALVLEQYGERNWLDEKDLCEGRENTRFDKFDESATYVTIRSAESETIASMRIVKDSVHGFPHESQLGLSQFHAGGYYEKEVLRRLANTPREKMAEVTKVAGKRRQRMLTRDLAKCIYWYAMQADIELYLSMMDMEFFILCTNLGVPIDPIGIPLYCEGSWTIPAVIAPDRFEKEISREHQSFWEYISARDNLDTSWA